MPVQSTNFRSKGYTIYNSLYFYNMVKFLKPFYFNWVKSQRFIGEFLLRSFL